MEGAFKIEPDYLDFNFDDIPDECILKDAILTVKKALQSHPNLVQYAIKRDSSITRCKRSATDYIFGRRLDVGGEIIDTGTYKYYHMFICSLSTVLYSQKIKMVIISGV